MAIDSGGPMLAVLAGMVRHVMPWPRGLLVRYFRAHGGASQFDDEGINCGNYTRCRVRRLLRAFYPN